MVEIFQEKEFEFQTVIEMCSQKKAVLLNDGTVIIVKKEEK